MERVGLRPTLRLRSLSLWERAGVRAKCITAEAAVSVKTASALT